MKTISLLGCLVWFGLLLACAAPTAAPTAVPIATLVPPTLVSPTSVPPTPPPTLSPLSERPRVLRIGQGSYPDVLDSQKSSFEGELAILRLAYEGLTRLDEKGNVIPGAAETWKASADGKQMTFHLRAGLKRADGTPLQCADFEYALRREVDPRVPGKQYTSIVYDIKGAEELDAMAADDPSTIDVDALEAAFKNYGVSCTDPSTLKLEFKKPNGFWDYVAATWLTYPTDQKAVDKDPEAWWTKAQGHNGNGMFRISEIVEGKKIVFEANPNYWGGRAKLDRIEFLYDDDPAALFEQYQQGKLDLLAITTDQLKTAQANPTLAAQIARYPAATTSGIQFNHAGPPFNDRNVRIAVSQALDREGYVREVLGGIGVPYTRWIPPGVPGAQPNKAGVPATDAKAAVKTLVENGYAAVDSTAENPKVDCDRLGEIKVRYSKSSLEDKRFHFLANNLKSVFGCEILLDPVDPTCYGCFGPGTVQPLNHIWRMGWIQDYPHPSNWLSVVWTCAGFAARSSYCNPEFDALTKRADETTHLADALPLYQQAEDLLLADVPAAFTNVGEYVYLVAPYVKGIREHTSSSDAAWVGQYGPILEYDVDLAKVPDAYPKQ